MGMFFVNCFYSNKSFLLWWSNYMQLMGLRHSYGKCDHPQRQRHHCFKSGNIPKTEGGLIHLNFMTVL